MTSAPFKSKVSREKLRKCQRLAYEAILSHYQKSDAERNVIVQLPTGTGKTALIAITPFSLSGSRVLVLTPNVKLARDMADELDIIKNPGKNAYKKFEILSNDALSSLELYVLRLESSAGAGDIKEHHIIVANYQQLQDIEKWFSEEKDAIDLIVIDEAHHQAAQTYQEIIDYFPNAKVIGLTATPFRSDGKRIEGKFVYKYSFNEAIRDDVIRNLRVVNVAPEQVQLEFTDQDRKTYTLKQVLDLKEESWFRRGIALSQDCCDSIAQKAREKLEELRTKFPQEQHQIIAAAISKRHGRENVKPAFEKLGLKVGLVSSASEDSKTNDENFIKLKQGKIDVIVHIGMLGEGFDHPPLGVAAIFRPYLTLNPYIQFIGRVIRKNGSTPYSYVVSHLGLNQLQRFEEFKMFDYEDQEFMKELFSENDDMGDRSFVDEVEAGKAGSSRQRDDVPVIHEIGDNTLVFESQFVTDPRIAVALSQFEQLDKRGKEAFLKKLGIDPRKVSLRIGPKEVRVKPVEKRKASRNLLNEREKSIATDILKALTLKHYGRDFNKLYLNFTWVKKRVSKTLNQKMNIQSGQRKSITNAMFESMEAQGLLKGVQEENLEYFTSKLNLKRK